MDFFVQVMRRVTSMFFYALSFIVLGTYIGMAFGPVTYVGEGHSVWLYLFLMPPIFYFAIAVVCLYVGWLLGYEPEEEEGDHPFQEDEVPAFLRRERQQNPQGPSGVARGIA